VTGAKGRRDEGTETLNPEPFVGGTLESEMTPRHHDDQSGRALRVVLLLAVAAGLAAFSLLAVAQETADPPKPSAKSAVKGYEEIYRGYKPDFITRDAGRWAKRGRDDPLRLSYQKRFFNMAVVEEDARVDAYIAYGRKREADGEYRDAMAAYRKVIEEYPHVLYRVAEHGIFIPARRYCQKRILSFPPNELAFYRAMFDAPARDAFERARRRYSLLDLREVADAMMATSYGAPALFELGNAALDIGSFEEALGYYRRVRGEFADSYTRDGPVDAVELALKTAYCRKALDLPGPANLDLRPAGNPSGDRSSGIAASLRRLSVTQREQMLAAIGRLRVAPAPFRVQRATPPSDSTADYRLFPPTDAPLGLKPSAWQVPMPVAHRDYWVFFHPVATKDSLIYRHKNIIYCRSLLSGGLRWQNDLGGRVVWQNQADCFFPSEEVLVQDGLVYTTLYKGGASLVALDEVTGRLRWAHGPIAPVTEEDTRTSYFACPAGGRRAVYASYVLDNIEGETHIDSVYGVRAFEAATGRILWSREVCRLNVGKFMLSELTTIRNRIRSYATPPVLHEGTLYCVTNSGVMVALEASTGSPKWLTRYPYKRSIHDRTRALSFISSRARMRRLLADPLWYNQRPLILGERMIVLPVDSEYVTCVDRETGRIVWTRRKGYVDSRGRWRLGREARLVCVVPGTLLAGGGGIPPPPEGRRPPWLPQPYQADRDYLLIVYTGPSAAVQLIDADTGRAVWRGDGLFRSFASPQHPIEALGPPVGLLSAQPFVTTDAMLYVPHVNPFAHGSMRYGIYSPERCLYWVIDLKNRTTLQRRLYYDGQYLALADKYIRYAQRDHADILKNFPDRKPEPFWTRVVLRFKDEAMPVSDPPQSAPFYPFARMTFSRHDVPFEVFVGPRALKMKCDRGALNLALAALETSGGSSSPTAVRAVFGRAELAILDGRMSDAARLLETCLTRISNEDVAFRQQINQQLYTVYLHLLRKAIKRRDLAAEDTITIGMSRTAGTTPQEIQTLLCRAEYLERKRDYAGAALCLRNIIRYYGHIEYPISRLQFGDSEGLLKTAQGVMANVRTHLPRRFYDKELLRSHDLMTRTLPSYFSAASPLRPTMRVEARALASRRLQRLLTRDEAFRTGFERTAAATLAGGDLAARAHRLREFPATPAAQTVLDQLLADAEKKPALERQRGLWHLEDFATLYGLTVPDRYRPRRSAPTTRATGGHAASGTRRRIQFDPPDQENTVHLVLRHEGEPAGAEHLLFLGGRATKRLDNKFVLTCYDLNAGTQMWATKNIRLKGKGDEKGFEKVFLRGDLAVTHGLYDVIGFDRQTGAIRWRTRVPFGFEIRRSIMFGDILVLSSATETVALYLPSGEIVWEAKETGDLYYPPFIVDDTLVSVRYLPSGVTSRKITTGRLIAYLELPDLTRVRQHPFLPNGPEAYPVHADDGLIAVTDGFYYIVVDARRMTILWKRLIDASDPTREPFMRLKVSGDTLWVLKKDFDQDAMWMLSSRTGEVLWHTDPKKPRQSAPMYSPIFSNGTVYGLQVTDANTWRIMGYNARTGAKVCDTQSAPFAVKPTAHLDERVRGTHLLLRVADQQQFSLVLFDTQQRKAVHTLLLKGTGPFGVHGRVSYTVQGGALALLTKTRLTVDAPTKGRRDEGTEGRRP